MFIEPTITWVPSGFSGYIWFDTKIVLKNIKNTPTVCANINRVLNISEVSTHPTLSPCDDTTVFFQS